MRMGNNVRIAVFREQQEKPLYHVKFKAARELVEHGRAKFIDPQRLSIRLILIEPVAKSSQKLACGQGDAYEKAAIEKHLQYFGGGLNRTEHQPSPFNRWRGAKVGHQS